MAYTAPISAPLFSSPPPVPSELRAALLARIEQGQIELPLLPRVAQDIIAETEREGSDARHLAELIRRDAAVAGHVLRVANSPLFMPPSPIVSLQQAISRLGMESIRRIALLIACQTRVFRVAGWDAAMRRLFGHSLATAAFSQEIARMRRSNVEEAFLCGLLHDVGRPVILQALSDLAADGTMDGRPRRIVDPIEGSAGPPSVAPSVALGLADELHGRVGGALVARWGLPPWLSESLTYHHDPLRAPTCGPLAATTSLADGLSHVLLDQTVGEADDARDNPLWAHLNIYPDQVAIVLRKRGHIAELVRSLS